MSIEQPPKIKLVADNAGFALPSLAECRKLRDNGKATELSELLYWWMPNDKFRESLSAALSEVVADRDREIERLRGEVEFMRSLAVNGLDGKTTTSLGALMAAAVLADRAVGLIARLHREEALSEGQCCQELGMERVAWRELCDELNAEQAV